MNFNHERIKELRVYHNLKQNEVAKELKISPQNYNRYEKGTRQITIELLVGISNFYHIDFNFFFDYKDGSDSIDAYAFRFAMTDYAKLYDEAFQETLKKNILFKRF